MPDRRDLTIDPEVEFVETPYFSDLSERALTYLKAGAPVHFQGPSGTGKTTCALHVAKRLGRPMILMSGNDQYTPADLVGRHFGMRRKLLVDNYIHSVERREEQISHDWVDGRLLTACKDGYTLVYDEFSRSRPEANNALLSVLEEGMLELPPTYSGEKHIKVHPEFRAIFTSNPDEYAGVHRRPDALLDRMITMDLSDVDDESVLAITMSKTGLSMDDAVVVVDTVRRFRKLHPERSGYSIRSSLLIASVLKSAGHPAEPGNPFFDRLCQDVLGSLNPFRTEDRQEAEVAETRRGGRRKEPKNQGTGGSG